MRPAGRLQAAIEILQALETTPTALDRLLRGYFRSRRYAGAGDRAAIAERVHGILRRRGELLWRCGGEAPQRLLVLAGLRWLDDMSLDAIDDLCTGRDHAPVPLTAAERTVLARPPQDPAMAPDWVRGNYPDWLDAALARAFGDDKLAELTALNRQAPLDLRVNSLRRSRQEVLTALQRDGLEAFATELSPLGIRLPGRPDLRRHPLYLDGSVEIQDEGSQLVAVLVDPAAGEAVVDFCAGAGGKTLALAAAMNGQGVVHALDTDERRLRRLRPRLDRAGAGNVRPRVLREGDDAWLRSAAGSMDRVLVDAPCSGHGAWRRQPEARWRLDPDRLAVLGRQQQAILRRAAALVRPGGRLVYATCSLLCEENEDQVAAFLHDCTAFTAMPMARIWADVLPGTALGPGPYLRLSPLRHGCDGFFVAVLQRSGDEAGLGPGGYLGSRA